VCPMTDACSRDTLMSESTSDVSPPAVRSGSRAILAAARRPAVAVPEPRVHSPTTQSAVARRWPALTAFSL